ncbi:MutR family transcriptional regulator [Enterococcus faecalis]|nr:MutR family transcriptional regulator [Enterococcus faecalis]
MEKNTALIAAIKAFRQNRQITQQKLGESPTRYAKIEATGNIRFNEWLTYLKKLEVTPAEFLKFMELQEGQNNFILEVDHLLNNAFEDPEFIFNKRKIIEYYSILDNKENKTTAEFSLYIDIKIYFCNIYDEVSPLNYEDCKYFYKLFAEKFKKQEFYTYYDYRVFSNIVFELPILELSKTENVFQNIFPLRHSLGRDKKTIYVAYLSYPNFISRLIYEGKFDKAYAYLKQARKQSIPKNQYLIHLQLTYLELLLDYIKKQTPKKLAKIDELINAINIYGHKDLAEQMNREVKMLTEGTEDKKTSGDYPKTVERNI